MSKLSATIDTATLLQLVTDVIPNNSKIDEIRQKKTTIKQRKPSGYAPIESTFINQSSTTYSAPLTSPTSPSKKKINRTLTGSSVDRAENSVNTSLHTMSKRKKRSRSLKSTNKGEFLPVKFQPGIDFMLMDSNLKVKCASSEKLVMLLTYDCLVGMSFNSSD